MLLCYIARRYYELCRAELQTTFARANSTSGGISGEDGSLTRSQALERFGIDLGRVGAMTSARTAFRHSLIDGGSDSDQGTTRGGDGELVAPPTKSSDDVDGIGRGKSRANRTEIKRGRGGSSDMTTVTMGHSNNSSKRIAARKHEVMSEKLKVLDKLLSEEILCQMPVDEERKKTGKKTQGSVKSEDDSSPGVSEKKGTGINTSVDVVVDRSNSGDDKGGESRLGASPPEEAPSCTTLAEKIGCEDSRELVPEPKETTTVANIHAPDEGERRGAADARDAALQENATVSEARNAERHHGYKEALPNHR